MIADIVVGAVVFVSALISFLRGFIREVLTIIGVVGGILAAIFFGPKFIPVVNGWYGVDPDAEEIEKLFDLIPMDMVASATAYGLIFLVVVVVLSVASHFLAAGAKAMGLGPVDRTLGVIFGIVRGVVLLALLYWPVSLIMGEEKVKEVFADSRTHVFLAETVKIFSGFLPSDDDIGQMGKKVEDSFKKSLMEQDILKREGGAEKETPPASSGPEGYKDGQREDMNKLFQQEPGYNE